MSFAEKYVLIEYKGQNQYNKVHVWTHGTILVPLRDEYIILTLEFERKNITFGYWKYKKKIMSENLLNYWLYYQNICWSDHIIT